jgi:hypothetical protein
VATPAEVKPNIGETGMSNCEAQMSDDHLLMQDIVETCGITVKQLAAETGLAGCTIYRYLEGSATIPSVIWRKLYDRTEDVRILSLITGEKKMVVFPLRKMPERIGPGWLREMVEMRRKQIGFENGVLKIIEDERIDRVDTNLVAQLKKAFPDAASAMGGLYYAVIDQFERSTKK